MQQRHPKHDSMYNIDTSQTRILPPKKKIARPTNEQKHERQDSEEQEDERPDLTSREFWIKAFRVVDKGVNVPRGFVRAYCEILRRGGGLADAVAKKCRKYESREDLLYVFVCGCGKRLALDDKKHKTHVKSANRV